MCVIEIELHMESEYPLDSIGMVVCRGHRKINTETRNKFTNYLLSKKCKI